MQVSLSYSYTCISMHKITTGERRMANNIQWPINNAFSCNFWNSSPPQGYDVILYKQYMKNTIPLVCAVFIRLFH